VKPARDIVQTAGRWIAPALLGVLAVALLGATLAAGSWKRDLRVVNVRTEGNRIVTAPEIVKLAGVEKNAKLFDVDLYAVAQRLKGNRFISDASVSRNVPDGIVITVVERTPIVMLLQDQLFYVDADGVVLPLTKSEQVFDLPVLSGVFPDAGEGAGKRLTSSDMREALSILTVARAIGDDAYRCLSEVHLQGDGEFVLYTSEYGVPVQFGRGDVIPKMVKFDAFWNAVVGQRGAHDLLSLDLRFEDQVIARWK
jgi:cell division septal protein FtsQ